MTCLRNVPVGEKASVHNCKDLHVLDVHGDACFTGIS